MDNIDIDQEIERRVHPENFRENCEDCDELNEMIMVDDVRNPHCSICERSLC